MHPYRQLGRGTGEGTRYRGQYCFDLLSQPGSHSERKGGFRRSHLKGSRRDLLVRAGLAFLLEMTVIVCESQYEFLA